MSKHTKQHGEHTKQNHGGHQTWQKAHDKKAHESEKHAHSKKAEHTNDHSWKHESEDWEVEEDD